jgi:N-acetylmuramate 1-kinase
MTDRILARAALLANAGWADATATFLAGDASDRTYDRLNSGGRTAVLMDAPPGKGEDPATFVAVADHLRKLGLSAPCVLADDLENGLLLLEDFGDGVFARAIAVEPTLEPTLYEAAIDVLIVIQSNPAMAGLPDLSPLDWANAAALVHEAYAAGLVDGRHDFSAFADCMSGLIDNLNDHQSIMILRDFHAENLMWLPEREGVAKTGLLDFQLAQMGHPVYDLVSLLQDARRDVSATTTRSAAQQFCENTGLTAEDFELSFAIWGAQRALRILGVFARLARQSGKIGYLRLMPRVWGHLQINLQHPKLSELKRICDEQLPTPTTSVLERLAKHAKD